MKKLLIHFLTIFGTLVCMPTLLAQQDIKLFSMLNPLPLEMKVEVLKNYSSLELLKLYDILMAIRRKIPANTGNSQFKKAFIEEVVDTETKMPFEQFKGDNLLAALQMIAGDKVAKLVGCSLDSMQDGTCQPLKDYPGLTDEQKAVRPFAESTGEWTKNWVRLLPIAETMNARQKFMGNFAPFWKTNFLKIIDAVDKHPEQYLEDTRGQGFLYTFIRAQAPQTPYTHFMTKTYLSLLPQAVQDALVEKIKQIEKRSKIAFTGILSDNEYARANKEIFFSKLKALKLPNIEFVDHGLDESQARRTDLSVVKKWWQFWKN